MAVMLDWLTAQRQNALNPQFPNTDAVPTGGSWGRESITDTGPSAADEASAYGTGFARLVEDPNFGRVSPGAVSAYYDLAGKRAFGEGNERINAILAERGFGPNRVGMGAEMAGRLGRDIELHRAGAELGMSQEAASRQAALRQSVGQSRYGALTRGGTRNINRTGYQAQPAGTYTGPSATVQQRNPFDNPYNTPQRPTGSPAYIAGGTPAPGGGGSAAGGGGSAGGGGGSGYAKLPWESYPTENPTWGGVDWNPDFPGGVPEPYTGPSEAGPPEYSDLEPRKMQRYNYSRDPGTGKITHGLPYTGGSEYEYY